MSEKQDLAVLFSLLDRPIAEFVESEAFKRLEREPDVIRNIEPFGLPEVKKLICCSSNLSSILSTIPSIIVSTRNNSNRRIIPISRAFCFVSKIIPNVNGMIKNRAFVNIFAD